MLHGAGWFCEEANVGIHIPALFCSHMGYISNKNHGDDSDDGGTRLMLVEWMGLLVNNGFTMVKNIWLVLWNICFFSRSVGKFIIATDFSEAVKPATSMCKILIVWYCININICTMYRRTMSVYEFIQFWRHPTRASGIGVFLFEDNVGPRWRYVCWFIKLIKLMNTPYAPCMVYLPTFGWFLRQLLVNIPSWSIREGSLISTIKTIVNSPSQTCTNFAIVNGAPHCILVEHVVFSTYHHLNCLREVPTSQWEGKWD